MRGAFYFTERTSSAGIRLRLQSLLSWDQIIFARRIRVTAVASGNVSGKWMARISVAVDFRASVALMNWTSATVGPGFSSSQTSPKSFTLAELGNLIPSLADRLVLASVI